MSFISPKTKAGRSLIRIASAPKEVSPEIQAWNKAVEEKKAQKKREKLEKYLEKRND